jgi:hypothetical protein
VCQCVSVSEFLCVSAPPLHPRSSLVRERAPPMRAPRKSSVSRVNPGAGKGEAVACKQRWFRIQGSGVGAGLINLPGLFAALRVASRGLACRVEGLGFKVYSLRIRA